MTSPEPNPAAPRPRQAARTVGLILLLAALAVAGGPRLLRHIQASGGSDFKLIPADKIPASNAAIAATAPQLLADYPDDPRAHLYRAMAYMSGFDVRKAEAELRTGLAQKAQLQLFAPDHLEEQMDMMLALNLVAQNRRQEAKAVAAPACAAAAPPQMQATMAGMKLCEP